jgi:uncharacterized membrane protein YheB (UPF0754 family)
MFEFQDRYSLYRRIHLLEADTQRLRMQVQTTLQQHKTDKEKLEKQVEEQRERGDNLWQLYVEEAEAKEEILANQNEKILEKVNSAMQNIPDATVAHLVIKAMKPEIRQIIEVQMQPAGGSAGGPAEGPAEGPAGGSAKRPRYGDGGN